LRGVGGDAGNVIAKRAKADTVLLELLIYEHFLSRLPITSLKVIGSLIEDTGQAAWLFVEDAGEESFTSSVPGHRRVVAEWLAALHTGAATLSAPRPLPVRDSSFYGNLLREARALSLQSREHPELTPAGHVALDDIERIGTNLEERWSELDDFCGRIPLTLVHGDFVKKNVRVSAGDRGRLSVFVYDWEMAGLGSPAADLAMFHCDGHDDGITRYFEVVRERWPTIDYNHVSRMAHVGAIFRYVAALNWACKSLRHARLEGALKHIPNYTAHLHELTSKLG
jgi:aminoglycoside phosphotransferase (APT) family kinase protein